MDELRDQNTNEQEVTSLNESPKAETEQPPEQEKQAPNNSASPSPFVYRWTYADQLALEAQRKSTRKKHNAIAYVCILGGMFLLCIALLFWAVVWYGDALPTDQVSEDLTTPQIHEAVASTVVLIEAIADEGRSYGTGFFIDSNGYIATNYHVIEGYKSITVYLNSGYYYTAKVVGFCEAEDLALIKIDGNQFPVAKIGNSLSLKVGEKTVVVGNPGGMDAPFSTMEGIVSALNRKVLVDMGNYGVELSMIQTSAPVSHGNSGGPLFNAKGEVIGVITRKLSEYDNVGLALPINGCMKLLSALKANGKADGVDSGFSRTFPNIGVQMEEIVKGTDIRVNGKSYTVPINGVLVTKIISEKKNFALKTGDVICMLGDVEIEDSHDLIEQLYRYKMGESVTVKVWRQGTYTTVTVTLGEVLK